MVVYKLSSLIFVWNIAQHLSLHIITQIGQWPYNLPHNQRLVHSPLATSVFLGHNTKKIVVLLFIRVWKDFSNVIIFDHTSIICCDTFAATVAVSNRLGNGVGIWPSDQSGRLARRRSLVWSSAGTASIHLDVYPQRREHSWDGYACYTKVLI
jgi:hypothetical protein